MVGLLTHVLFGDGPNICNDATQQALTDVRMEMRFELVPIDVLAADDQIVESSRFLPLSQILGNIFVVALNFIVDTAFGVAGIVTRETVSATAAGQSMEKGLPFLEFVEVQIKNAGAMAIYKSEP